MISCNRYAIFTTQFKAPQVLRSFQLVPDTKTVIRIHTKKISLLSANIWITSKEVDS